MSATRTQNVKCVIIGDNQVGKTAVIAAFAYDSYPGVLRRIVIEDMKIDISIWDTNSDETDTKIDIFLLMYDVSKKETLQHLQSKWHQEKDWQWPAVPFGVVGCKSDCRKQFHMRPVNDERNGHRLRLVIRSWLKETKSENLMYRVDEMVLRVIVAYSQCTESRQRFARYEDGEHMARALGASGYVECSAYSREGIDELFETACLWAIGDKKKILFQKSYDKRHNKKGCVIL